ncbi:Highly reducing polyketide synthase [Hyphodiscus hymeniophilus]|uniref:Highly reducing polyketide synthase n=1 Tax=Hyphodiscus hymeniophilus TaxID=353542 RepID=A0A9P6VJ38_9HELO|nr:Highly reducing polyketide synthase [Hyphodiscus hymeniophilus]
MVSSFDNTIAANGDDEHNGHSNGVNGNAAAASDIEHPESEPVAIIGMACRFPQEAADVNGFWETLIEKRSAMTEFPKERMNIDSHYHPDPVHAASVAASETSIFVGAFTNDYQKSIIGKDADNILKYVPTGTSNSIMSNRVSWFFDLRGTSLTLDTACSSSLVAFHLACQDLHNKNAKMAIVSGVNVIHDPESFYRMGAQGFLSPDSRCFSFDHRANGYSRGEGVGTLIIKPLSAALKDGDTIRAVVRGTGVNSDGRTPGITLPSKAAQESLIRSVYASAGLDLKDTGFVEAHGTGTAAGDPLEAGAIAAAWKERNSTTPLYVGALKSNVGHMEGASGVAGLIKSVLILEQGIIPPNIGFEKVNPKILKDQWNIDFPLSPMLWPGSGNRRISINSFGFGGTNAHVVLDDAFHYLKDRAIHGSHVTNGQLPDLEPEQVPTPSHASPRPRLFVWSSPDEAGTRRTAHRYGDFLASKLLSVSEESYLDDLSYTLASKRTVFPYKTYMVSGTKSELVQRLTEENGVPKAQRSKPGAKLGFIFTGQGAQWAQMGIGLFHYSVFKSSIESADSFIKTLDSQFGVLDELQKGAEESLIHHPTVSQTLCTVIQIAFVELLASWNILPARVVGHSSGEIAAAFAAGAISREYAWKVAYYRGVVSASKKVKKGAMLAVGMKEQDLAPYMKKVHGEHDGELVIACFNSPKSLTISGDEFKIDVLKTLLDTDKIFARKLKVVNAYHTSHMKPVAEEYASFIGDDSTFSNGDIETTASDGQPTIYSSVTGKKVSSEVLRTGLYWVSNLISEVRFSQALLEMCSPDTIHGRRRIKNNGDVPLQVLLEVGPHPALQSASKDTLAAQQMSIAYMSTLRRNTDDMLSTMETAGRLFCLGCSVDINSVNGIKTKTSVLHGRPAKMLVDLPGYVFNHSQEYWAESRYSKNFRFRKHPRHDLLGVAALDWNPAEPKWRHHIRLSENPWLNDHKVTQSVVYPGVGYLVMAIEASKQLARSDAQITGFRLRNVSIIAALQVPDLEDGIETMLSMRAAAESSLKASTTWREFSISSFNPEADTWTEHCHGQISTEYETDTGPIDKGREAKGQTKIYTDMLANVSNGCEMPINITELYGDLETIGLKFGPLFRNISTAKVTGKRHGETVATITTPNIAESMPRNYLEPHIIHPATMDSMLQLSLLAFQDLTGGAKITEPLLPVYIQEVWLSAGIGNRPGQEFTSHGSLKRLSPKKLQCDITVWQAGALAVKIRGMHAVPLQRPDTGNALGDRRFCYNIDWQPDVDFLTASAGHTYYEKALDDLAHLDDGKMRMTQEMQLATLVYIRDALNDLDAHPPTSIILPHHEKWLSWMRYWQSKYEKGEVAHQTADWPIIMENPVATKELLARVETESIDGRLLARVGNQIASIVRQETDPLQLLFGDDILEIFYRENFGAAGTEVQLQAYLKSLSHKRSNLKVLEIGAGTGGTSGTVLAGLSPREAGSHMSSLASYTYTDISAGFFEGAKAKFKAWRNVLDFKILDIEKDLASQGFEEGEYDVIVAANYALASEDLFGLPLCFGPLPGWWLGPEPERQLGALLTESNWNTILSKHSFAGTELCLRDSRREGCIHESLIISTALDTSPPTDTIPEVIIVVSPSISSEEVATVLQSSLKYFALSPTTSVIQYMDIYKHDLKNVCCIVLAELDHSVIGLMDEELMRSSKHIITTAGGLIWITKSMIEHPEVAPITGLIRTVRWERDLDESNLVILSFDDPALSPDAIAVQVSKVYEYQFLQKTDQRHAEYAFREGLLEVNRLISSNRVNDFLNSKITKPAAQLKPFGEDNRALALSIRNPGLLNTLEFVDDTGHNGILGPEELEIQVKASGLNFRDVMVAMGEIDDVTVGLEASGVVVRVGEAITDRLKVGTRVMFLSTISGCIQTYARTTQDLAIPIPDNMTFEVAAGIPVTFSTVFYSLVEIGRLSKGESILIHAAAGGVGQAAIELAQHLGAEIYVTVSSEEKKRIIMETYGIPAERIFSSRGLSFSEGIMRATNNRGVDVVLNSLSGEALRKSWECIAPFGRFIEIGKKDIYSNGKLDMFAFSKSATFAAVDLNLLLHLDPKKSGQIGQASLDLWKQGVIHVTTPYNVFSYGQIEEAFRLLQSGKHIGKVVLTANESDVVPAVPPTQTPYRFPPNATYVLPGGLGGIGRSIARWMVSRGAKNLVFLSRSGYSTAKGGGDAEDAVGKLLEELEKHGCTTKVYSCDVSDKKALTKVLDECKESLPPIKGCITGAMQLKDSAFENMSLDAFNAALRPKVQGSYNLHELLPTDMDFFIMLSSVAGLVGNRGQANYAAGNNYQDALARHRVAHGLAATTIDLGNILAVGFMAEHGIGLMEKMTGTTEEAVREDELHSVIEYHIDARHSSSAQVNSQVAIGLVNSSSFKKKGTPEPSFMFHPLFSHLRTTTDDTAGNLDEDSGISIQSLLQSAQSLEEAGGSIVESIVKRLSTTLAMPTEDIDPTKPIHFYGVDSLVAMEFRNWFGKSMASDIPILDIMGNMSIAALSRKIASVSRHVNTASIVEPLAVE